MKSRTVHGRLPVLLMLLVGPARSVLSAAWPADQRQAIVGDLDDELAGFVARERPVWRAAFWYWSQVARSLPAALSARRRRRAMRRNGGLMKRQPVWRQIRQDGGWALRVFRRAPGLTLAAVVTLALGIGANTAVFSVVQAVILRPLPYPEPDRLVRVWSDNPRGIPRNSVSPADLHDLATQSTEVFSAIGGYVGGDSFGAVPIGSTDAGPQRILGATVTPSLFDALGVAPASGRTLIAADAVGEGAPVMVISDGLWRRLFDADPATAGRTLTADGTVYTVVGVMPPQFAFPDPETEVWVPLAESWRDLGRSAHFLQVVGRLRRGATIEEASARLDAIAANVAREFPDSNEGWGTTTASYYESVVGESRASLLILLAAVGCILLIACANVANLLLSRGIARSREFAVRQAIGAGRARLIRQVLVEGALLGLAGGVAGLALGWLSLRALLAAISSDIPRLDEVTLDGQVLAFSAVTSIAVGMLSALAPALRAGHTSPAATLTTSMPARSRRTSLVRNGLLVAETAIMVALLVGAGLLIRTLATVTRIDPGFRGEQVLLGEVSLPGARYDGPGRAAFYEHVRSVLARHPSVEVVGAGGPLPLSGSEGLSRFGLLVEGRERDTDNNRVYVRRATPGYFQAMGIPLRQGRTFTASDTSENTPVVVIDEALARAQFPGEDPIGRRIRPSNGPDWREIVGIVGSVRQTSLQQSEDPHLYLPQSQWPSSSLTIAIRAGGDPAALQPFLEEAVRGIDAELPVFRIRTLATVRREAAATERSNALLLGVFAALAGILTLVGVHGIVRHSVTDASRELGLRLALGARPGQVLGGVLARSVKLQLIGVGVGLLLAWLGSTSLSTALYGVSAADPLTYAAASAVVVVTGALAAWLPARRVLRIDPVESLR